MIFTTDHQEPKAKGSKRARQRLGSDIEGAIRFFWPEPADEDPQDADVGFKEASHTADSPAANTRARKRPHTAAEPKGTVPNEPTASQKEALKFM